MRKIRTESFNKLLHRLDQFNQEYIIEKKRGTRVLNHDFYGKIINIPDFKNDVELKKLNPKERIRAKSVFSQVAKSFNNYLLNNNLTVKKIKLLHKQTKFNSEKWRRLRVGSLVYYVDVDNCYWVVAHSLGYINKKLYERFKDDKKFKTFRNMSLAAQTSEKEVLFIKGGTILRSIKENKNLQKTMYQNIRFTSYNLMGTLFNILGKNAISYRTDGILLTHEGVYEAMKFFADLDMDIKLVQYRKANVKELINMKTMDIKKV